MIRNLLASTAIAALMATGAAAQTSTDTGTGTGTTAAPAAETPMVKHADGSLASNLIGERVYNGSGDDAQNIGKVNDLVLDSEGNIQAIVVGVGGFLGLGEKEVALEYDLVEWTDRDGEEWLVVETTKEALEAQQEFDRAAYQPMPADADVAETEPATAEDLANAPTEAEGEDAAATDDAASGTDTAMQEEPADDGAASEDTAAAEGEQAGSEDMAATDTEEPAADDSAASEDTAAAEGEQAGSDEMAASDSEQPAAEETTAADEGSTDETQTGAIDRSSLQEQPAADIRAEDFVGTTVYGANDEDIGEIGDVILTGDGQVDAIIVDVGGFLGIGEKEVAVGMDNLQFMTDGEGELYLYTEFTEEQLESQPAYDEGAYAEQRDEMRMSVE